MALRIVPGFGGFRAVRVRDLTRLCTNNGSSSPIILRSRFHSSTNPIQGNQNGDESKDSSKSLPQKARGLVSSIIHGSPEVVADHEKSTYSKIIARGKYVHQLETHHVKPEAQAEYAGLLAEHYPKILERYGSSGIKLCGSWTSDIGELDKSVHIWEYDGYSAYDKISSQLKKDEDHLKFLNKVAKTINKRENQMCLEFAFWATSPPKFNGGVYELRTYLLKPGRLLEWEQNWKIGLECRRMFTEPVGAWFSQLGDLNYVHHMWVYPNLHERKMTREQAWKVDGWAETVYNTVRLIERMQATILTPMPFSPLK